MATQRGYQMGRWLTRGCQQKDERECRQHQGQG